MKNGGWIWLVLIPFFWSSCRTDFETVPSNGNLLFSKDTVYLDTIFTNIGSSTYNLKVYNSSKEDISIPSIRLSQGEASLYRLNVDGISAKTFTNIDIPARDSIFIFIETTVDINSLAASESQFLYSDAIEFDAGEQLQKVPLITLVMDAIFLYPSRNEDGSRETITLGLDENGEEIRLQGFYLGEEQLHFTNNKPYVIYGYAAVPQGEVLRIDAGARLHFHENSGIIVSAGASIQAEGKFSDDQDLLEQEIVFEGDRLEPGFSDIPGQWGTIWLRSGSINNSLNHVTIKNASIGLWVEGESTNSTLNLSIKNTQIYNSAATGLLAQNAGISGENLVINNSGQASLHISLGGNYNFKHSSFANYWDQGYRQYPAVLIENFLKTPTQVYVADLFKASFFNCIIYGNLERELLLFEDEAAAFNFSFSDCLIKFVDENNDFAPFPNLDFSEPAFYENIILNQDPQFVSPQQNDLRLQATSPARNRGNIQTALEVPLDILNNPRTETPDLGAYETF